MKRLLIIFLVIVALIVAALFIYGGQIREFVRTQIEEIASEAINPQLTIGKLSYRFPFTVILYDMALEQDDIKIAEIPRCTITMDRIPYTQGQIRFSKFNLESPVLRLVVNEKNELVGWGDLVKSSGESSSDSDTSKASDSFAVRNIVVSNASIEYIEMSRSDNKMVLDEINLDIDARPSGSSDTEEPAPDGAPSIPEGAGWYRVATKLDRSPLIEIEVNGGLDIDSGDVLLRKLDVTAAVDPKNASVLPPQLQVFVRDHNLRGKLGMTTWGTIIADDPFKGPVDMEISLDEATIGTDKAMLEITSLKSKMNLKDDIFFMESLDAEVLGGSLEADAQLLLVAKPVPTRRPIFDSDEKPSPDGSIPGRDAYSMAAGLQLVDIDLQKLTSTQPRSSQVLGKLNADIEMTGNAMKLPDTLMGGGTVNVSNGRFTNIPIISALSRAMQLVISQGTPNDRAEFTLRLRPDGVVLDDISIIAELMAAHGRGIIRFDNTIDLVVNGGPLERVQASLGALGRALGRVTDRVVRYQITGSLESPSVRVRPFGIFVRDPTAPPPETTSTPQTTPPSDESTPPKEE